MDMDIYGGGDKTNNRYKIKGIPNSGILIF